MFSPPAKIRGGGIRDKHPLLAWTIVSSTPLGPTHPPQTSERRDPWEPAATCSHSFPDDR